MEYNLDFKKRGDQDIFSICLEAWTWWREWHPYIIKYDLIYNIELLNLIVESRVLKCPEIGFEQLLVPSLRCTWGHNRISDAQILL
jgi:hypothetical protein